MSPNPAAPALPPHERSYATYAPFLSLLDVEIPVIAAMQGHAIGGGFGLALVCDLRVANRDAKYGSNFVRLGLSPGMATTYLLPRLVGLPRALELLLTGRIVTGAEAAALGLANDAVAPDAVLSRARELAREIASAAPQAVRWTKRLVYAGVDWDPRQAARAEAHYQSRTQETDDFREGVAALLGEAGAEVRGALERLDLPDHEAHRQAEQSAAHQELDLIRRVDLERPELVAELQAGHHDRAHDHPQHRCISPPALIRLPPGRRCGRAPRTRWSVSERLRGVGDEMPAAWLRMRGWHRSEGRAGTRRWPS